MNLTVKVNSVQEACAKCFAIHILKFEILQTAWKNKTKNIKILDLLLIKQKTNSLMFIISFFSCDCKISSFNKWTGKHMAQASCTELTLHHCGFWKLKMPSFLKWKFNEIENYIPEMIWPHCTILLPNICHIYLTLSYTRYLHLDTVFTYIPCTYIFAFDLLHLPLFFLTQKILSK